MNQVIFDKSKREEAKEATIFEEVPALTLEYIAVLEEIARKAERYLLHSVPGNAVELALALDKVDRMRE
ncbi:MAG TPA: hypothetical protein VFN23_20905 [Ktedonobacteraceae bacterium]|nr:hypothetical protein [Ktedonobacteraceae bacterium]